MLAIKVIIKISPFIKNMIKDIKIIHKGEDYIKVQFERNGKEEDVDITGEAIEIIERLCLALHKDFPENYQFEN